MPRTASAPRFVGDGKIVFAEREYPDPGPGELLLAVEANAICGTDREQYYDGSECVPGHEAAGVVIGGRRGHPDAGRHRAAPCSSWTTAASAGAARPATPTNAWPSATTWASPPTAATGPSRSSTRPTSSRCPASSPPPRRPSCSTSWGPAVMRSGGSRACARTWRACSAPGPDRSGWGCWRWPRCASGPTSPSTSPTCRRGVCVFAQSLGGIPVDVRERNALADLGDVDAAVDSTGKTAVRRGHHRHPRQAWRAGVGGAWRGSGADGVPRPDRHGSAPGRWAANTSATATCRTTSPSCAPHRPYLGADHHPPARGRLALQEAFEVFFGRQTGKVVIEQ